MLSQITTATLQEFVNNIYLEKGLSKKFEKIKTAVHMEDI